MPAPLIHLTVKTTSGAFRGRFNRANRARRIVDDAVRDLGLPRTGVTYVLERLDGTVLSLSEKIADLGLEDQEVLVLRSDQAQDG